MYSSTIEQSEEYNTRNSSYLSNRSLSRFRLYSVSDRRRELYPEINSLEISTKYCCYDRLSDVSSIKHSKELGRKKIVDTVDEAAFCTVWSQTLSTEMHSWCW
jgi:hypothetical protein